jgi:hypothetical protein
MLNAISWKKPLALFLLAAGLSTSAISSSADDDPASGAPASGSGLYIKVRLSKPVRMSKLKPGDAVEGNLSRDVYSADRKLFSAGSKVRLTVDSLEKRKRARNDHWPWVVQAFTPRHEKYPVFKNAAVLEDTGETPLQVSLISVTRMREVQAKAKKKNPDQPSGSETGAVQVSHSNEKKPATPTMVLEAFGIDETAIAAEGTKDGESAATDAGRSETLPAATRCKILLLGNVSASKSRPGDAVQARLLEPVLSNERVVLPAGTLFEGKVMKRTPPRMLSRAGSLYMTFTQLTLPGGPQVPVAASLAGAELDQRSHTRIDAEGKLHGERPGKAWMAINLGMTAGIAKVTDDGLQLVIEAIVSTATDVSTAGTARIVSSCASAIFLATRHGRNVILPRFTELDISLDRPLSVNPGAETVTPATSAGGK